jgi:hypothetical protein
MAALRRRSIETRNRMKYCAWTERSPAVGLLAVLSAGAMIGPWFRPADGRAWQLMLAAAAVALIALLSFVGLSRARSARRWKATLDAYAAREMIRNRRRSAPLR